MRLVDTGNSFKKIMDGRNWVGRVAKHATEGVYLGIIGKLMVKAPTERAAFEEVVARHFGHASAAALHEHNSMIRQQNNAMRKQAKVIVDAMHRGDFEPFTEMLDRGLGLKGK